jgi:hypothetical protein
MPRGVYEHKKGVRHLTEEHKRKIGESHKGWKPSEENRKKMSEGQLRRFANSPTWNKGKHLSEETKRKISLAKIGRFCGENHPRWKGDDIGYAGIHDWIEKEKGKPSKCDICETTEAKKFEWCNKNHKYKRNLSDWFRACTRCHRRHDKILLKRIEDLEAKLK